MNEIQELYQSKMYSTYLKSLVGYLLHTNKTTEENILLIMNKQGSKTVTSAELLQLSEF